MAYASWSVVFGEQPSTAKWNILGTNDAHFNNVIGTGSDSLLRLSQIPTQDGAGSNTTQSNVLIKTGWNYIAGDGTIKIEETITTGATYDAAPLVFATYIGRRLIADGTPTGTAWFTDTYASTPVSMEITATTTTQFTANLLVDTGSTLTNTYNHGYVWMTIGVDA